MGQKETNWRGKVKEKEETDFKKHEELAHRAKKCSRSSQGCVPQSQSLPSLERIIPAASFSLRQP